MLNAGKLAGYTLFITGGSRGIGKQIALKAAQDGAKIVIAAKTAVPNPKLAGTIYTAAEEIEKAGGKCLPCIVDVQSEEAVQSAVDSAVKEFGGIDILVNNASAISLTGTLATPMKRYDLMNQINARGTYLCSRVCLPHLLESKKNGKNPHILNISPPLNLKPIWFKNHTAYTIAKYGMSLCVIGMAEEFKGEGIAVNGLWPRTAINTAAMDMLGGADAAAMCRKPEIMADAAYAIFLKKASECTGNILMDDDVLKEEGIVDFDQYAVEPGRNLIPDLFVDSAEEAYEKSLKEQFEEEKRRTQTGSKQSSTARVFDSISSSINPDLVKSVGGVFKFILEGDSPEVWIVDLKNEGGSVKQEDGDSDVVMTSSVDDFVSMFSGKINPTQAYMQGKLNIKGNMGLAMKLEKVMKAIESASAAAAPSGPSKVIDKMKTMLSADLVTQIGGVYQFKLSGADEQNWVLDLKNGAGSLEEGLSDASDVTMSMKDEDFVKIFSGELSSTQAFMQGKLKIDGNMGLAMKLEKLIKTVTS